VKDESANKRKRLYMVVHSCFIVGRSEGGGREVVEGEGREGEVDLCLELLLLLRILSPKALLNCGSDGGCRGLTVVEWSQARKMSLPHVYKPSTFIDP
jgi:hypothetical protein